MTDTPNRDALEAELAALNAEWDAITAKRKAWMDEHMADFAKHPIGTKVYVSDGRFVGTVGAYYRYHADDPRYDTSMDINYRFTDGGNTSSQSLYTNYLLNEQELADRFEQRARSLRHSLSAVSDTGRDANG